MHSKDAISAPDFKAEALITGKWLDQYQVMKLMGISRRTLYTYRKKHKLAERKIGKQSYFLVSDLDAFIEKGTHQPGKGQVSKQRNIASPGVGRANKDFMMEEAAIHYDHNRNKKAISRLGGDSIQDHSLELIQTIAQEKEATLDFNPAAIERIRSGKAKLFLSFNPIIFRLGLRVLEHCFPDKEIGFLEDCVVVEEKEGVKVVDLEECFREVEGNVTQ